METAGSHLANQVAPLRCRVAAAPGQGGGPGGGGWEGLAAAGGRLEAAPSKSALQAARLAWGR
jgi:hypothetical protein